MTDLPDVKSMTPAALHEERGRLGAEKLAMRQKHPPREAGENYDLITQNYLRVRTERIHAINVELDERDRVGKR